MSDCSLTTFRTQLKTLLFIDSYIFSLPDSAFAAFLRGSCALQITLIIIIIIIIYVYSSHGQ